MSTLGDLGPKWANAEQCRRAAVDVARIAAGLGIRVMAMKGLHLAFELGAPPWRRAMVDADILVLEGRFVDVVRVLEGEGWTLICDDWSTKTLGRPDSPAHVDLHRFPMAPLFGRMRRASLARRAQQATGIGGGVLVPDLIDATLLALAHHVKDGVPLEGLDRLADDVDLLASHGVDGASLAARAREHRMRRIALAGVLSLAERRPVIARWASSFAGPREIKALGRVLPWLRRAQTIRPALGLTVARMLGDDAAEALASVAWGAGRLLRDQVVGWGG